MVVSSVFPQPLHEDIDAPTKSRREPHELPRPCELRHRVHDASDAGRGLALDHGEDCPHALEGPASAEDGQYEGGRHRDDTECENEREPARHARDYTGLHPRCPFRSVSRNYIDVTPRPRWAGGTSACAASTRLERRRRASGSISSATPGPSPSSTSSSCTRRRTSGWLSNEFPATASSPAPGGSTVAPCSCSRRTSPSSAARSRRRTRERSAR